jgi:uncharacterized protein (TIGR02266 family)
MDGFRPPGSRPVSKTKKTRGDAKTPSRPTDESYRAWRPPPLSHPSVHGPTDSTEERMGLPATETSTRWDSVGSAPAVSNEGLRQHRRVALSAEIHLESESNLYAGITNNISEGGVFVATPNLLDRGTVLDLEFSVPDGGPPIRTTGLVRWIREDLDSIEGPPGMGVQFVELDEAARRRLERFVQMRDTIYFDDDLF